MNGLLVAVVAAMIVYDVSLHIAQALGVARPWWGPWFTGDGWQRRFHAFWASYWGVAFVLLVSGVLP